METRRVILYSMLAFILYSLWNLWQIEYPKARLGTANTLLQGQQSAANALLPDLQTAKTSLSKESNLSDASHFADSVKNARSSNEGTTSTAASSSKQLIHVKTDVLALAIDTEFGDIVHAELLNYPLDGHDSNEKKSPVVLLTEQSDHRYTANSSLLQKAGSGTENIHFNFRSKATQYELNPGEKNLEIVLEGESDQGLLATKTFVLTPGKYQIGVRYELVNQSAKPWEGFLNLQIFRTAPSEDKSSLFHVGSFTGASYSNPGVQRYKKVNFTDMNKANLNLATENGWIAMQQHYFLSAWVPNKGTKNTLYTRALGDTYTIGLVSQPLILNPGQQEILGSTLYVGPEITSDLKALAPSLDLTIDYGWLWFLSAFLFTVMKSIYQVIGNWGWAIVLVTVLVKLVFYRLSASSYRSMAGMRKLQPKLQALRERYGDDKAKLSQATMEMYRQEKINPLGGCLPILVQIPVFIALYWVLLESVELRQAPFIFWISDLSAADPYHVLPIIMGITMLIQQRLNPAPPDPMQAKIMMGLPILFTGLFWSFPSGLVLYWIVNNTLSILQQWLITRKYG